MRPGFGRQTQQKILLDELNHRVKNNMQMLCGLLETVQREASPEAQAVLRSEGLRGRPPDVIGEIEKPFLHYCIRQSGSFSLIFSTVIMLWPSQA